MNILITKVNEQNYETEFRYIYQYLIALLTSYRLIISASVIYKALKQQTID